VKRSHELLAGALLALFGVFFSLLLLEAGVRFLHLVPDRFWEPDADLGVRLVAGKKGWWTQEDREFVVPIQINSQGRRDIERDFHKPEGVRRVLVLGDSFVEAMHVPLEAVFFRQLEERLVERLPSGPRVEVIAAGVSGYGTAGELLYLRREGKRYRPDVVLLSFYPGNDIKNNSPELEDKLKPIYGADGALLRVSGQAAKDKASGWRAIVARSRAYLFLRQLLLVRQPGLAQRLVRLGLLRPDALRVPAQRDGIPVDFGVYEEPVSAEWQRAWSHTERLLDELHRTSRELGAQLALMIVSTRDQVYPDSWQRIVAANPVMQQRRWDLDAPQRRVEAWCRDRGVPYLAMAPLFREVASRGGEALHFAQDGHWTKAGHTLAATALEDFLLANSLLKAEQEGVRP
jgi:lysophospholipase L1-like esterase